ncbi:trimethylguanosine synthase-like isoform X2 [Hordeum vulgare subsp. vulgare]|uniref:Trimethylguanosine synthase n=1 Tax=Hordeum vulgare subsp. vulgare TaxID=112509 RepID=A0A8I6Y9Y7_HORVV|nr:trimethylguanosine synthase-like isoform X2 [Hordeum vulgare subsp. vulgare]
MAKASATPKVAARRRAKAVRPLPNRPHRFLRLVAAIRKLTRRRPHRRGLAAVSQSSPPPPPTSDERKCANRPPSPSPPPAEAEQARHEERTADAAAAAAEAVAGKYWAHRHSLFSLYDRGVRMDAEGWYSATPEAIAAAQAARAAPAGLVLDAFAGVGGNSIQFAARGCYVVSVEIDPRKVELARHNARIYGVEDRIEFVVGDFFHLAPYLKADLVFLSPPWGGPSYNQTPVYTLDMLKPKDGHAIFQAAQNIAPNIIMFLPRNVDIGQVEELSWLSSPPLDFESEESYVQHRFKGITAYFGDVAR